MIARLKLFMSLALMAVCTTLYSQELSVQAPKIVAVGEQFTVVFSAAGSKVEDFKWDAGDDFKMVWGPVSGVSRSFSSNNGKTQSSVTHTFSYVLEAKAEGSYAISSASAVIDGTEYVTSPVMIEVIAGSGGKASGASSGSGTSGGGDVQEDGSGDVFMSLTLNKRNVVVGEPVIATLKLYTNVDLSGVENMQFPVFNGCWSQETDAPANLSFQRENVNGRLYQSALLRRYMLIPQQSGTLTVDPAEMVAVVVVRNSSGAGASIFDSFFDNYQTVRRRIRTDKLVLNVSPLPEGAPQSFKGGVGKFSIQASVNSDTLKMHEAATLTVTVSGNGNIALVEPPAVSFPSDFEVYDVKVSDTGTSAVSGTKKYEFPFIPRSSGTFDIPAVEYSYYDISSKKYVTLRSAPIRLTVLEGEDGGASVFAPGANRRSVKNLNEDIRFIYTGDPALKLSGRFFVASPLFFCLTALILVLTACAAFLFRRIKVRNSDLRSIKNRKANRMALKRLKMADTYLKQGMYSAFYEELHKALLGYISDKLGIQAVDMSRDNISAELSSRAVPDEMREAYLGLLDACEFARYSPDASDTAMQSHYNEALRVISTIDGMINSKKQHGAGKAGILAAMLLVSSVYSVNAQQDMTALWSEANSAYEAGEWKNALDGYSAILSSGMESDRLYYNMGNAYYKSGDIAHSILYYEKALKLNPSFDDARSNLEMVSAFTTDRIEAVPEFVLKAWFNDLGHAMGPDGWAWTFIVLLVLAALSVLAFLFKSRGKTLSFVVGIVFLALSLCSLVISLTQRGDYFSEDYAIVVSYESFVRSSPSDENTKSLFVLHEGTKVEILEELGDWCKIEIADGRQGWMKGKDIGTI